MSPPSTTRTQVRPHAAWWAAPVLLVLAGIGLGVWCAVRLFTGTFGIDATVPADGTPYAVTVDDAGRQLVWVDTGRPTPPCTVVDGVSRKQLRLGSPTGSWTKSSGGTSWRAAYTLETEHRDLLLSCDAAPGADVQIGSALSGRGLGSTIAGIFLFPLLLGGGGLLWVVLLALRWSRSSPRG